MKFQFVETIYCVVSPVRQTELPTYVKSIGYALFPETAVDVYVSEAENSDSNTSDLNMPDGDPFAGRSIYINHIALFGISLNRCYRTRKDPRMESLQGLLLTLFQQYSLLHFS